MLGRKKVVMSVGDRWLTCVHDFLAREGGVRVLVTALDPVHRHLADVGRAHARRSAE